MTQSNGKGVGGVETQVQLGSQAQSDHFTHLLFVSPAVSCHNAFYLGRGIFVDAKPPSQARRNGHSSSHAELEGTLGILRKKSILDGDLFGLELLDAGFEAQMDEVEALEKLHFGGRVDGLGEKQPDSGAFFFDEPDSQMEGAGIDP